MIQRIRDSFYTKVVTVLMVMSFFGDLVYPNLANALTGGDVDINQVSFEPASTSEMVNLATGDFTYNIPLLDVGGYPINLAYHAGVTMEQEASIVGLGWTVNVGALNRSKRGLPDDFKGDQIKTTMNIRPTSTVGGSLSASGELVGGSKAFNKLLGINPSLGVTYNNYIGTGVDLGIGIGTGFSIGNEGSFASLNLNIGVGLESSSQNGLTISPNTNITGGGGVPGVASGSFALGIGTSINSITGLTSISANGGAGISVDNYSKSGSSSGTYSIGTQSYTPSIGFENSIKTNNFDFDAGGELFSFFGHVRGGFFKSLTCLVKNEEIANAYGYLYQDDKQADENYLLDFNRSGVVIPNDQIKNLPVTNHTFDVFNATGQGVAASFRAHRNDILRVSDAKKVSPINGFDLSGEIGFGSVAKFGININISSGYSFSGDWKDNNDLDQILKKKDAANEPLYEDFYFKKLDNRATIDYYGIYSALGGKEPMRQNVAVNGPAELGMSSFSTANGSSVTLNGSNNYQSERIKRNTNIEYLTAKEAINYGFEKMIRSYDLSNYSVNSSGSYNNYTNISRYSSLSTDSKAHHLSELSILNSDGSTYIYGIPVLNQKSFEVAFNVSNEGPPLGLQTNNSSAVNGLVAYNGTSGSFTDNSITNRRGANNLYLKKEIPASANSFLLTASLSSNYIDRTGDGPTVDDYGSYTKFNYAKLANPSKWRIPVEEEKAAYNIGLLADEYDDVGSYVYGERDQWYLHSIESKNYVAEFIYSNRHDGYGAKDENGGIDFSTNNSKRLVAIKLYTRLGKINGEAPIKTVHFEYNYELCQNVPNNDGGNTSGETGVYDNQGGKLTLKAIYFTYNTSNKGKLYKYKFDYNDFNPDYLFGQTNRWGTYSKAPQNAEFDETGAMGNFDWPYVNQNKTEEDINVSAWSLKKIHLPSGSDIDIVLESDDYSYLQNRDPSKMYKILGFSSSPNLNPSAALSLGGILANNYIHIDLGAPINSSNQLATFKKYFLKNLDQIYFKCLVKVSSPTDLEQKHEYISGYAELDKSFVQVNGSTAILKLWGADLEDDKKSGISGLINPIQKASWQFVRKYLTNVVVYPRSVNIFNGKDVVSPYGYNCDWDSGEIPEVDKDNPKPNDDVKNEGKFIRNIYNIGTAQAKNLMSFGGFNAMMVKMLYCNSIVPNKSFVRLFQGESRMKLGGGHRVKQISVNDNWSGVVPNEESSSYGTKYTYTTVDDSREISSGVASYEPISAGGDENSFREPVEYTIDVKFRVNDGEFHEKPFGESIFANPSIVYSKIQVKNISYDGLELENSGSTEYEFYTAKDFPSVDVRKPHYTDVQKEQTKAKGINAFFSGENYRYLAMSQGYTFYLNDMHGKFKSKTVYGATSTPNEKRKELYSLKHEYYKSNNSPVLSNSIRVISKLGAISYKILGREIDMVVDNTASGSLHSSTYQSFDLDVSPFPVPTMWIPSTLQDNKYFSSVTTKVIYNKGILKSVELVDKGRIKKTTNLLFDENTGTPILTKIESEEEQTGQSTKFYQYDFPAYWAHNGMGHAADNWGAHFEDLTTDSDGEISLANIEDFFNSGDEIMIEGSANSNNNRYWVYNNGTSSSYIIIDRDGNPLANLSGPNTVKIIKSGKQNMLGSTMQSYTLHKTNDLDAINNHIFDGSEPTDIVNASAVQYSEKTRHSTGETVSGNCDMVINQIVNPYVKGLLGNWNLQSTWVYDKERVQDIQRIRTEGKFAEIYRIWQIVNGKWVFADGISDVPFTEWLNTANATLYNEEGYNLESNDVLGTYSSILLGYNQTVKVAEAVNARYGEIAFDGFEDRTYEAFDNNNCYKPFFVIGQTSNGAPVQVSNQEFHSGKNSAILQAGQPISTYSPSRVYPELSDVFYMYNQYSHGYPFKLTANDLIPTHSYVADKKYVFSAWIKEDNSSANLTAYDNIQISAHGGISILSEKRSNIIDGWQRIEVIFKTSTTSPPTEGITITSTINNAYIDDVRIHPFNSEMVSYVINPTTLRLDATLDSRNFATFYQYDEEGSLVRIIQETEKGRTTVQENRAGIKL